MKNPFSVNAQTVSSLPIPTEYAFIPYVNPEISEAALDTLLGQQVCHKLEGKLCGAVDVAHKTGEDSNLSNDVGIVFAKEPFVICFAGHDTDVYPWEDLIRRSAWALWNAQQ